MNGGGPYNEFIGNGIHYLLGEQYELARKLSRQKMWREMNANKYKVQHFVHASEAYNKIFDIIIKYYARVRDSVTNLEEIWVFLMEIVYQQELKGQLIFEQFHKQLFESEV